MRNFSLANFYAAIFYGLLYGVPMGIALLQLGFLSVFVPYQVGEAMLADPSYEVAWETEHWCSVGDDTYSAAVVVNRETGEIHTMVKQGLLEATPMKDPCGDAAGTGSCCSAEDGAGECLRRGGRCCRCCCGGAAVRAR